MKSMFKTCLKIVPSPKRHFQSNSKQASPETKLKFHENDCIFFGMWEETGGQNPYLHIENKTPNLSVLELRKLTRPTRTH